MTDSNALLSEVALAARLAEGPEGVRYILRSIFRGEPIPIRDLAREVSLPVPVVAAVRGELESRKLLDRRAGIVLTERGRELVCDGLGIRCRRRFRCRETDTVPEELGPALEQMRGFCTRRPRVDVRLDQSHATPETAIRRALYLLEMDALEGRALLVLGDDDLTSLSVCLVSKTLGSAFTRLAVVECDTRLTAFIRQSADELGVPIQVFERDLRAPLPSDLTEVFDAFLTDPPYTLEGLSLFVSRGLSALRPGPSRPAAVCFGHRTPDEAAAAMAGLAGMGLAPVEILPGFNYYVGAQMLAGSSQMIRLATTSHRRPDVEGDYDGPLYTAQARRPKPR